MIDNKLCYNLKATFMGLFYKFFKAFDITVGGIDRVIIGNIIPIIPKGRWVKWKQPYGGYAQIFQVIEFFQQPIKISYPITIAVIESFDVQFINNGIFIPVILIFGCCLILIFHNQISLG